tara:strand:+ start:28 stop:873 length:846 start_codon:yes stop_codon:yes gene_type:complete
MKIGIIGYGFVGKALEAGFNDDVEIIKIDPKLKTKIKDLKDFNPNAIFICVPTPMGDDFSQDLNILKKVLLEIENLHLKSLIVLKSTVLPDRIQEIEKIFPNFVYNPEFLREDFAFEDFISSKLIVFGGIKDSTTTLATIYKNHSRCLCTDYVHTDAVAASLIKYTINSFLATKVTFFNELNSLFNKSGTSEKWRNFTEAISKDKRIGSSHMEVPGSDGRFGFGGACLPKDTNAFSIYAENVDNKLNILKTVISTNNNIRASYNTQTERELEQNIKFKGDE